MTSFKDRLGREWVLDMTLRHCRIIETRLGVSLLTPETAEQQIMELVTNPMRILDMIWVLVEKQAADNELTRDDLEDALDGQSYMDAEEKFIEELVNFIHSLDPTRARLWKSILAKVRKVSEVAVLKIEAFLDSQEMDEAIEKELDQAVTQAICTLQGKDGK